MGGASGGFTSGRKEIIEILRQRSRPYLFSNTVAPAIVGAAIEAFDMLSASTDLRDKRKYGNTHYFRKGMTAAGFDIKPGDHPIVPIMLGEADWPPRWPTEISKEGFMSLALVIRSSRKAKRASSPVECSP